MIDFSRRAWYRHPFRPDCYNSLSDMLSVYPDMSVEDLSSVYTLQLDDTKSFKDFLLAFHGNDYASIMLNGE